jgi:hypothetical protein
MNARQPESAADIHAEDIHKVRSGHYPYLVTGCGRSGTHFTAKFLSLHGMDIGHEETATLGSVSWLCASDAYCRDRAAFFEKKLHQIRHPLPFIRSWQTVNPRAWAYVAIYAPQCRHPDTVVAAARYWLYWNEMAMTGAQLSLRLEDFSEAPMATAARLSRFFDRPLNPALIDTARESGDSRAQRRDYGRDSNLDLIREKDPQTFDGMAQLADKFCYRL